MIAYVLHEHGTEKCDPNLLIVMLHWPHIVDLNYIWAAILNEFDIPI